jgi:hypothetical protein
VSQFWITVLSILTLYYVFNARIGSLSARNLSFFSFLYHKLFVKRKVAVIHPGYVLLRNISREVIYIIFSKVLLALNVSIIAACVLGLTGAALCIVSTFPFSRCYCATQNRALSAASQYTPVYCDHNCIGNIACLAAAFRFWVSLQRLTIWRAFCDSYRAC